MSDDVEREDRQARAGSAPSTPPDRRASGVGRAILRREVPSGTRPGDMVGAVASALLFSVARLSLPQAPTLRLNGMTVPNAADLTARALGELSDRTGISDDSSGMSVLTVTDHRAIAGVLSMEGSFAPEELVAIDIGAPIPEAVVRDDGDGGVALAVARVALLVVRWDEWRLTNDLAERLLETLAGRLAR